MRIFPVEHIKGWNSKRRSTSDWIGWPRSIKELIDKYVYVGLSRAKAYWLLPMKRQFPTRLKCIEQHFESGGSWAKCLPGQSRLPNNPAVLGSERCVLELNLSFHGRGWGTCRSSAVRRPAPKEAAKPGGQREGLRRAPCPAPAGGSQARAKERLERQAAIGPENAPGLTQRSPCHLTTEPAAGRRGRVALLAPPSRHAGPVRRRRISGQTGTVLGRMAVSSARRRLALLPPVPAVSAQSGARRHVLRSQRSGTWNGAGGRKAAGRPLLQAVVGRVCPASATVPSRFIGLSAFA